MVRLTQALVRTYGEYYDSVELTKLESDLFNRLSELIAERNFLKYREFLEICEWKSARTRALVRSNSELEVMEVSRLAFSGPDFLRHRILCLLRGVAIPKASSILAVWQPSQYTVYDFRVCSALGNLKHPLLSQAAVDGARTSYLKYTELARELAADLSVSLRALDKALWSYDKFPDLVAPIN